MMEVENYLSILRILHRATDNIHRKHLNRTYYLQLESIPHKWQNKARGGSQGG